MPSEIERHDTAIAQMAANHPDVMSGAMVFSGTRVPIDPVFDDLLDGMSAVELLENVPSVDRQLVAAAIRFGVRPLAIGPKPDPKTSCAN